MARAVKELEADIENLDFEKVKRNIFWQFTWNLCEI